MVQISSKNWYNTISRTLFFIIFAEGSIVHFVLGSSNPEGYAVFATTAWQPLSKLWVHQIMPNIRAMTILIGVVEFCIAIGLFAGKRYNQYATLAACFFFIFLLLLGYGMPQQTEVADCLVNRLFIVVIISVP